MIKLYNTRILSDRPGYNEIYAVLMNSDVDFEFMWKFLSYFKAEDKIDRPITVLVVLYNDYIKRGGVSLIWFKTTAENYAIASRLINDWSHYKLLWINIYEYLNIGIKSSRINPDDKRGTKEIAKEIAFRMKSGQYYNPFKEGKKVIKTIEDIINKDYPGKNPNSIKTELYNHFWDE